MSMHSEPEDFEQVRRLLALKRHEQPPPGYFNHFSRDVIARLRAGEGAQADSGFFLEFPLLQRLWTALEARPVLTGAVSVALCGFLTAGFLFSDNPGIGSNAPVGVLVPGARIAENAQLGEAGSQPFSVSAPGLELPGTVGMDTAQMRAALFRHPGSSPSRLINFTVPAGN